MRARFREQELMAENGHLLLRPDETDRLLRDAFDAEYTLRAAARSVPAELRPQWRIPVLLLILRRCRGRKANWRQLHVLNWAIRSQGSREAFSAVLEGRLSPDRVLVRYEPNLGRVIDLAVGLGFVDWEQGRLLALSEKGREAAEDLTTTDALVTEREFLDALPGAVTQRQIDVALEGST